MTEPPHDLYSVLIVCGDATLVRRLKARLPVSRFASVTVCGGISEAARLMTSAAFDLVLVDAPEEQASAFAASVCEKSGAAVMLFLPADAPTEKEWQMASRGVATVTKPPDPHRFDATLALLCATRERLRRMEKKARTADEKMEEIRLCNRAKWLLIERVGMTEPDAHRYIEKAAMNRCMTKRAIAESIIKTYS